MMRAAALLALAACAGAPTLSPADPVVDLRGYYEPALCFSPDGAQLVLVDGNALVAVETATGTALRQLPRPKGEVAGLEFSPDGRTLLCLASDAVWIVDAAGGETRRLGERAIEDACFMPDGAVLLAVKGGLEARDPHSGAPRLVLALPGFSPRYARPSPDGTMILAAAADELRLLQVARGDQGQSVWQRPVDGPEIVEAVFFTDDGREMGAVFSGGRVRVWNPKVPGSPREISDRTHQRTVDLRGDLLATGRSAVTLRDFRTGAERAALTVPRRVSGIHRLRFSPGGRWLAAVTMDGDALVWDLARLQ